MYICKEIIDKNEKILYMKWFVKFIFMLNSEMWRIVMIIMLFGGIFFFKNRKRLERKFDINVCIDCL